MRKYSRMQLIITSIVILIPIVIGLLLWNKLPERMVIHWNGSGEPDGWSSKGFAVFGLPLILFAAHWIAIFFTTHDPKNKNQNSKLFDIIILLMPITSLEFCSATYAIAMGRDVNINFLASIFLGIVFILVGNYLPKCKQNYTIGIKIVWTLNDEENWNKTHRFAGKLWVIGGVVLLATVFISAESFLYVLLPLALIMVLVPILYSYLYDRKQQKAEQK